MKVFIAGALSSREDNDRNPSQVITDYIRNVHRMCVIAGQIRKLGHEPFIPGLDFLVGVVCGDWVEEDYRGMSDAFLPVCEAVLVISMSWGVQGEIELAKSLGIPVYYSIDDLPIG